MSNLKIHWECIEKLIHPLFDNKDVVRFWLLHMDVEEIPYNDQSGLTTVPIKKHLAFSSQSLARIIQTRTVIEYSTQLKISEEAVWAGWARRMTHLQWVGAKWKPAVEHTLGRGNQTREHDGDPQKRGFIVPVKPVHIWARNAGATIRLDFIR